MPILRRSSTLAWALLLLTSCARPQGLPPGEVLSRAALNARNLQSADFTVQASFDVALNAGTSLRGTASAAGRMQHSGRALQFTVELNGRSDSEQGLEQDTEWRVEADIIVIGEQEVYLAVHEFSTIPPHPLIGSPLLAGYLNTWWRLPAGATQEPVASPDVTPDPRLFKMQAEVVDVTRDRGVTTLHGRPVYHYDVAINPEKLVRFLEEVAREQGEPPQPDAWREFATAFDATGELWIDMEEFFIDGVAWTLQSKVDARPQSLSVRVELKGFNAAEPIVPPAGAQELPANPLDGLLLPLPTP